MDSTLIIYDYNVKGEVLYGECTASDYPNVKSDLESRGYPTHIIEEVYGDYFKCPISKDVVLVSSLA